MSRNSQNLNLPTCLHLGLSLFFLAICLCDFAGSTARAQDPMRGWEWQNPKPQGNSINAVRFTSDQSRGWAVGSDGVIMRTDNGGFEWEVQKSTANSTLYSIYVKDRSRAVISGARGIILMT